MRAKESSQRKMTVKSAQIATPSAAAAPGRR